MTSLTLKEIKRYLKFLNKYKSLVGLSDWKVMLLDEIKEDVVIARVYPDIWEKELIINLFTQFYELPENRRLNVLFHELLHARVEISTIELENLKMPIEEKLVNDLVRGFEALTDFKF